MIACFNKHSTAHSTTSASLSLSHSATHSQLLSDLLSFSHPLLPHISHLSLLYSGRAIWGSVGNVYVRLEMLHISVSLTPCPSSPLFLWSEVEKLHILTCYFINIMNMYFKYIGDYTHTMPKIFIYTIYLKNTVLKSKEFNKLLKYKIFVNYLLANDAKSGWMD